MHPLSVPTFGLPCDPAATLPIGIALFQGNYSVQNFSSATLLGTSKHEKTTCPLITPASPIRLFLFLPESSMVVDTMDYGMVVNIEGSLNLSDYWVGSIYNSSMATFPQGVYTVMGYDCWGQVGILHFRVL